MKDTTLKCLVAFSTLAFVMLVEFNQFFASETVPAVVHDYLDFTFPWKHLGAKPFVSDETFRSFTPYEFLSLNGLPSLHFGGILYMLLPPKTAYVATLVICKFLAFGGMLLLMTAVLGKRPYAFYFSCLTAGMLAACPGFWDQNNFFTDSLLPLTLWAFYRTCTEGFRPSTCLVIILVPFFASYHFAMIFVIFYMAVCICVFHKNRLLVKRILFTVCLSLLFFAISHYDYILTALHYNGFVSHRSVSNEINMPIGLLRYIEYVLTLYVYDDYHVRTYNFLFSIFCFTIFLLNIENIKKFRDADFIVKTQMILFVVIFVNCMIYPIHDRFYSFNPFMAKIPLIGMLSLRFHYMNQVLWYVCFGLSLYEVFYAKQYLGQSKLIKIQNFPLKARVGILSVLVIFQFSMVFWFYLHDIYETTYDRFFACSQFRRVKELIGKDQSTYRIATFGFQPSAATYNGFRTIDFYTTNYDRRHHQDMLYILRHEIEEDEVPTKWFKMWGSRCYMWVNNKDSVNTDFYRLWLENAEDDDRAEQVIDVRFDREALREAGVSYVVSRVRLNWSDRNVREIGVVRKRPDEESCYRHFYVYAM